jgi:hypothetical protein
MSERAQVELEYSARIEALGRKFSNSITEAAQNPLLAHSTNHAGAHPTGDAGKGGKTPSKATASGAAGKAPTTPAPPNSAVRSSFHAITGLASVGASTLGVMSTGKAPAAVVAGTPGSPGIEDISMELDDPNHGAMVLVDPGKYCAGVLLSLRRSLAVVRSS